VARRAEPVVAVDQPAGLGSRPAHRVTPLSLAAYDRSMPRHHDRQALIGLPLHANRFLDDLRLYPRALHAILVGRNWIQRFDVKILHVRAVIGKSPRDALVVADDDHRPNRPRNAFYVPIVGPEVNV